MRMRVLGGALLAVTLAIPGDARNSDSQSQRQVLRRLSPEASFQATGNATARVIGEADIIPNRAAGYRVENGQLKNQGLVSPWLNTAADSALYLTIYDMAKWDAALYTEKLLKKSSLEQMWTPVKLNDGKTHPYGFGWALAEVRGRRLIEHGGAWQGLKAHISRYVDDKMTVILFANQIRANQTKLAHGVAAIINPELASKN